MSFSIVPESLAIRLQNVFKIYKLYGSQGDQLIDLMGLQRFGLKTKTPSKEFAALSDICLDVRRGQRVGIIGRNGAGKTTLLKLICGNFAPTLGKIEVNGTVQALMNIGLGFHPEYTGRENVAASLQYNGLARDEYQKAMEGIVDFCELGDFIDQPFKTYSLGMQARLMFAVATAIRPDILIVDEVLGAGDAYFVAKSKSRVEKLVSSGCTMLLVSHSMQQVLELCDEAIWMDGGVIRMRGDSFLVVKAYEEHLHGPINQLALRPPVIGLAASGSKLTETTTQDSSKVGQLLFSEPRIGGLPEDVLLQEPRFLPHGESVNLSGHGRRGFDYEAPGGISRWDSERGLKITGFSIVTERGFTNSLVAMRPAKLIITLIAEKAGTFKCRYGIALNDQLGVCMTRIFSTCDSFEIGESGIRQVEVLLNPCQLGPGEYTVGISVLDCEPIEKLNSTRRYDLLSRSFVLRVELPESLKSLEANFFHTAEWQFGT